MGRGSGARGDGQVAWWRGRREPRSSAPGPAEVAELAERHRAALRLAAEDRFDEALDLLEAVDRSCGEVFGPDHPDSLTVTGNLAVVHLRAGHWDEGIDLLDSVLQQRAEVLGEDDPRTLAAGDALGAALRLAGRAGEALRLHDDVGGVRGVVLGRAHPDTLTSRMGSALALADAGDLEGAQARLRAAVADAERELGVRHRHTIALLGNLAVCEALTGRRQQAITHLERAAQASVAVSGRDHPDTVALYRDLADVDTPALLLGERPGAPAGPGARPDRPPGRA